MRLFYAHLLGIALVAASAVLELVLAFGFAATQHRNSDQAIYHGLGIALIGPFLVAATMPLMTVLTGLVALGFPTLLVVGHVRSRAVWIVAAYGLVGLLLIALVLATIVSDLRTGTI